MRDRKRLFALDAHDRRILRTLELNARQQNQDVARTAGLSPSACLQRVKRLEQSKIIRRYVAEIDLSPVDPWLQLSVAISVTAKARQEWRLFEAKLTSSAHIVSVDHISGRFDYLLRVFVPDAAFWPTVLLQIDPEGCFVSSAEVHICTRVAKPFSGLPQLSTK